MPPAWSASCARRTTSPPRQVHGRAVLAARAETGVATGFKQRGSLASRATERCERADAAGVDGAALRPRRASADAERGARSLAAAERRRRGRRVVHPQGRADQSRRHRDGAGHGRAQRAACASTKRRGDGIRTRRTNASRACARRGRHRRRDRRQLRGLWGHQVGEMAGVAVPLHAAEHFYVVTEPIAGCPRHAGAARSRRCQLLQGGRRQAAGGLVRAGVAAMGSSRRARRLRLWSPCRSTWTTSRRSSRRRCIACRASAGRIRTFFNGPESFTPDDRYLLGEAPELPGFFVAAGFNSIGISPPAAPAR